MAELVATLAVQAGQEFPPARQLRRFGKLAVVARTTGSLNVFDGEQGLLSSTRGVVRLRHFGCRALSAMADDTAPLFHIVAGEWMHLEWFGNAHGALQSLFGDG